MKFQEAIRVQFQSFPTYISPLYSRPTERSFKPAYILIFENLCVYVKCYKWEILERFMF